MIFENANVTKILERVVVVTLIVGAAGCAAPNEGPNEEDEGAIATTQEALTCQPTMTAAAITQQIVSVSQPTNLTVELVTISSKPYQLKASSLSYPTGFYVKSLATTSCADGGTYFKCRHLAVLQTTTACTGTGSYTLWLNYVADQSSGCTSGAYQRVDFSLTTENFCSATTVNGG